MDKVVKRVCHCITIDHGNQLNTTEPMSASVVIAMVMQQAVTLTKNFIDSVMVRQVVYATTVCIIRLGLIVNCVRDISIETRAFLSIVRKHANVK
jgi:hypothetical protein